MDESCASVPVDFSSPVVRYRKLRGSINDFRYAKTFGLPIHLPTPPLRKYLTDCTLSDQFGPSTYISLADGGGKIELFAQGLAQFLEPGAGIAAVNHSLQKA